MVINKLRQNFSVLILLHLDLRVSCYSFMLYKKSNKSYENEVGEKIFSSHESDEEPQYSNLGRCRDNLCGVIVYRKLI